MFTRWLSLCPSVCRTCVRPSIFLFPDDNLSICKWIFTNLSACIDIVEIWFGIANGQISSIFDRVVCPRYVHISFPDNNFSKYQWIFTKLGTCIDNVKIWFGIFANGQISLFFDSYLPAGLVAIQ